ncbi:sugar ABC transporter permease [Cohnella sp. WQ 127256]|uniref:ABC transporter permease n=1 Tax=Cohnella sp. WQ 127256 TaxID=2938790 RepID=UPI0021192587|nr:ABC transporter permease subunit [Cohnella sp. WQ 127256]
MKQHNFRTSLRRLKRYQMLFLLMVPGMAYLIINNYIPMIGILIAFKDYGSATWLFGGDWVGFKNFEFLFKTSDAWVITRNTLLYNGAFIVLNTVLGIAFAIFLNEVRHRFFSRFYQGVILMPFLISMVIVAYIVMAFLNVENGYLNKHILPMLGMETINWYGEPKYWPYILMIVNTWKSIGYGSVLFLAAIIGIDSEYYEAAVLDGATKWQQIRKITIPLIMPTITILTILSVGRIFYSDFGLFYQVPLNSGPLQPTTDVIDTYVYRSLITLGDVGMSSAAGLYQSVVGLVLVLFTNYIVRKKDKDQAIF